MVVAVNSLVTWVSVVTTTTSWEVKEQSLTSSYAPCLITDSISTQLKLSLSWLKVVQLHVESSFSPEQLQCSSVLPVVAVSSKQLCTIPSSPWQTTAGEQCNQCCVLYQQISLLLDYPHCVWPLALNDPSPYTEAAHMIVTWLVHSVTPQPQTISAISLT